MALSFVILGTDIVLFHGKTGKLLDNVDTNQLKNHMATISSNGRFVAAAAFTADIKVWEIVYSRDGSVKEVLRVMQLAQGAQVRYHLEFGNVEFLIIPITPHPRTIFCLGGGSHRNLDLVLAPPSTQQRSSTTDHHERRFTTSVAPPPTAHQQQHSTTDGNLGIKRQWTWHHYGKPLQSHMKFQQQMLHYGEHYLNHIITDFQL
nr:transducin beta-like protein 2 [Ipomoea trifida]